MGDTSTQGGSFSEELRHRATIFTPRHIAAAVNVVVAAASVAVSLLTFAVSWCSRCCVAFTSIACNSSQPCLFFLMPCWYWTHGRRHRYLRIHRNTITVVRWLVLVCSLGCVGIGVVPRPSGPPPWHCFRGNRVRNSGLEFRVVGVNPQKYFKRIDFPVPLNGHMWR